MKRFLGGVPLWQPVRHSQLHPLWLVHICQLQTHMWLVSVLPL